MNEPDYKPKFKDKIQVQIGTGPWLDGEVILASPNGRSLSIGVDEGVPIPYAIIGNQQFLALSWNGIDYDCFITRHQHISIRAKT